MYNGAQSRRSRRFLPVALSSSTWNNYARNHLKTSRRNRVSSRRSPETRFKRINPGTSAGSHRSVPLDLAFQRQDTLPFFARRSRNARSFLLIDAPLCSAIAFLKNQRGRDELAYSFPLESHTSLLSRGCNTFRKSD